MDDYDLLALFTAACLAGGHAPDVAVQEANTTLDIFRDYQGSDDAEDEEAMP